jgi:hypothetical protein
MRKYILVAVMLAALSVPAVAETNAQQQRMKDCNVQAAGTTGAARKTHDHEAVRFGHLGLGTIASIRTRKS